MDGLQVCSNVSVMILRLDGELVVKINGFIMSILSLIDPKVGWRACSKNQWFYHVYSRID
jgi:hypothetical protein